MKDKRELKTALVSVDNFRHVSEFDKAKDGTKAKAILDNGDVVDVIKAGERGGRWILMDKDKGFPFVEPTHIKVLD